MKSFSCPTWLMNSIKQYEVDASIIISLNLNHHCFSAEFLCSFEQNNSKLYKLPYRFCTWMTQRHVPKNIRVVHLGSIILYIKEFTLPWKAQKLKWNWIRQLEALIFSFQLKLTLGSQNEPVIGSFAAGYIHPTSGTSTLGNISLRHMPRKGGG